MSGENDKLGQRSFRLPTDYILREIHDIDLDIGDIDAGYIPWVRGLEFLAWLGQRQPPFDLATTLDHDPAALQSLAREFCAAAAYPNPDAFASRIVDWLHNYQQAEALVTSFGDARPPSALEQYNSAAYHAVLLFDRGKRFAAFLAEYEDDLNRLTRSYLDIYLSRRDREGKLTSFETADELDLGYEGLPAILLWPQSLRDHQIIPLHELSDADIYDALKLIVQGIRASKPLPDIVAATAAYVTSKSAQPPTVVNYYIANRNVSTGGGAITDYGGVQGNVNNNPPRGGQP